MISLAHKVLLSTCLVLALLAFVVLNLPIAKVLKMHGGIEQNQLQLADMHSASINKGKVWIKIPDISGLVKIEYNWCPRWTKAQLVTWCVAVDHDFVKLQGQFNLLGNRQIEITTTHIEHLAVSSLGLTQFVEGVELKGDVHSLVFTPNACAWKGLVSINGSFTLAPLQLLGLALTTHELDVNTKEQAVSIMVAGRQLNGWAQLEKSDGGFMYQTEGELTAPKSMSEILSSFLKMITAERFGWDYQGALTC